MRFKPKPHTCCAQCPVCLEIITSEKYKEKCKCYPCKPSDFIDPPANLVMPPCECDCHKPAEEGCDGHRHCWKTEDPTRTCVSCGQKPDTYTREEIDDKLEELQGWGRLAKLEDTCMKEWAVECEFRKALLDTIEEELNKRALAAKDRRMTPSNIIIGSIEDLRRRFLSDS